MCNYPKGDYEIIHRYYFAIFQAEEDEEQHAAKVDALTSNLAEVDTEAARLKAEFDDVRCSQVTFFVLFCFSDFS